MTARALRPAPAWLGRAGSALTTLSRLPLVVFALPLAALAAAAVIVINESSYARSHEALSRLGDRAGATSSIQAVTRRLLDAQTGQRGYLLTGRQAYLAPYASAADDVATEIAGLRRHYTTHRDPASVALLSPLQVQATALLSELAQAIAAYDSGQRSDWNVLTGEAGSTGRMAALANLSEQLLERERAHVFKERQGVFDTLRQSRIGVNGMAALGLVALLLVLRQIAALDRIRGTHTAALQAERERLTHEAQRRTADLTELAKHLQSVREDECSRLARDLHDELGALLTTTKLDVVRLRRTLKDAPPEVHERLNHLVGGIDNGIALKRRIIEDLRPSSLSNLGLVSALEIQAREFAARAGIAVDTRLEPVEMSDAAEITVYRLVQESLTNIAKYARASRVTVSMAVDAGEVIVSVADDGQGFEPGVARRSAHGLMGMRYRVEAVGGWLAIRSAPGHGTHIEARLPLPSASATAAADDEGSGSAA